MNPQSTDKVIIDTNNLVPRVVAEGSIEIPVSSNNAWPGGGSTTYYGTQTVNLNTIKSTTVPFIEAWLEYEFVSDGDKYYQKFNSWEDLNGSSTSEGARNWVTLTKNGTKLDINFYISVLADNSTFTYTAYYRITSANFTESSGL